MTTHYYTDNQALPSSRRTLTFTYRGETLHFTSDVGVFSKDNVDYGSRALLKTFDVLHDVDLLDIGCGYGVIGLSLAYSGENVRADLVDVNSRALALATMNAEALNLKNIKVYESDCYEKVKKEYDWIVSNPPIRAGKQVVHNILIQAKDHLKPGGHLRVVIQKKQGAPSAKAKMTEVFGHCEIIARDKGYYILEAVKQ